MLRTKGVLASKRAAFKRNARVSILDRAKKQRVVLRSQLSTRRTCVRTVCQRGPTLAAQLRRVTRSETRSMGGGQNHVKRNDLVVHYNVLGGMGVKACYRVRKTARLRSNAVYDRGSSSARVKGLIVTHRFVVRAKYRVSSNTVLAHYCMNRTSVVKRNCSTSSSCFTYGYRTRGNRTYTVFTNPCAIARRGSALLVKKVFSFVGTNSKAGRDGRVCGLKPSRRNILRHKYGATSNSRVL